MTSDHMPLIYIAGPYRPALHLRGWRSSDAAGQAAIDTHVEHAAHWGREVLVAGGFPVVPHATGRLLTRGLQGYCAADASCITHDDTWLAGDLLLLRACHGALFIPGWDVSAGAKAERDVAEQLRLPMLLLASADVVVNVARFIDPAPPQGKPIDGAFASFDIGDALNLLVNAASIRRQDGAR